MRISSPTKPGKYQAMDASDEKLASPIPKKSPTNRTLVSFSDIQEEKNDSSKRLKKKSSKKKLLKRFFGDKRKPSPQVQEYKLDNDGDGEDPVMAIFQSRNTQRVRFSVEVEEPENQESQELKQGENVKQFMSRALFSSTKSSNK
jgi:hypothetical protein